MRLRLVGQLEPQGVVADKTDLVAEKMRPPNRCYSYDESAVVQRCGFSSRTAHDIERDRLATQTLQDHRGASDGHAVPGQAFKKRIRLLG